MYTLVHIPVHIYYTIVFSMIIVIKMGLYEFIRFDALEICSPEYYFHKSYNLYVLVIKYLMLSNILHY